MFADKVKREWVPRPFIPFAVIPLTASLVFLAQNVLLGVFSAEALKIGASVTYLTQTLQAACISCANMTQGHVSRLSGEGNHSMIGSSVWQMIWFSLLSMVVTVPVGLWWGHLYFSDLSMEKEAAAYYYFLLAINFLYPLGATLASFFMGTERVKFIVSSIVGFSALQIIFFYFLILPFGLWGRAFSTLLAQAGYCLFLFKYFAAEYKSADWSLNLRLMWSNISAGVARAFHVALSWGAWVVISRVMMGSGEAHGYVFAVGSTLYLVTGFIPECLLLATLSNVSYHLGSKRFDLLTQFFRYTFLRIVMIAALFMIPMVFMSQFLFNTFFPKVPLSEVEVAAIFMQCWVILALRLLAMPLIGTLMAMQDVKFLFFTGFLTWILDCGVCALCYKVFHIPAHHFWIVVGGCMLIQNLIDWWRVIIVKRRLFPETEPVS
jgi:Na+-driven multidrug efflux pump